MTKGEIVQKALQKAIHNGFDFCSFDKKINERINNTDHVKGYETLIFSHDFCGHFFGTFNVCQACGKKVCQDNHDQLIPGWLETSWEYHIKEMVMSSDPLEYLRKFL